MKTSRGRLIGFALVGLATTGLIGVGVASCNPPHPIAGGSGSFNPSDASYDSRWDSCVPPLACGSFYSGYVPTYYGMHPMFTNLTPYRSFYVPGMVNHVLAVSRPAATASTPITSRLPYPAGYKPVPDSFRPPTAPKPPSVSTRNTAPKVPSVPSAPKTAPKAPTAARTRSK